MNKLPVNEHSTVQSNVNLIYQRVADSLNKARQNILFNINREMVKAYFIIGKERLLNMNNTATIELLMVKNCCLHYHRN